MYCEKCITDAPLVSMPQSIEVIKLWLAYTGIRSNTGILYTGIIPVKLKTAQICGIMV
jgi:hypothetical protein